MMWVGLPHRLNIKLCGTHAPIARANAANPNADPQPLAIFVDNDGDEATVVVELAGASRRTKAPFKTVVLHSYTIGPNFQVGARGIAGGL